MATMLIIGMGKPSKGTKHMNPMEQYMNASMSGGSPENHSDNGPLVEDEMSGKKTGKITFNQPAGFKAPEGVKDGEPFDAMATLKMVNGKLVLHELDGTPVEDEHEGEEEETPEEESQETPEKESSEEESGEEAPSEEESTDDSEPSTEEPDANDSGESEDFLSAVEKKAKKIKK